MTADSIVLSRIDTATRERAAAALEAMGLTISDAIRLLLLRVADEKRLPFEVKVPNTKSPLAMKELSAGKGWRTASATALFKDLGIGVFTEQSPRSRFPGQ
jgi:DNA-damage-inducible protein J